MSNPVALDRYQLLGELGAGSFGIVYLAYDPKLEREVAVKLVKPEIANDPDVKLRFRREWKAIGRLRHPNVIELLDYADGEWMYLVTERLKGKTLLTLCQELVEPMSPVLAAALVHEVALALEHAHEQSIVHRDVKPENIFLEPNGRVVLCDFGIAFAANKDEDTVMRGKNTTLLGSPLYMSPEQVASEGIGPPTDLFSLGAVAYFLVTGKEAFLESSVLGVLKRIQAGEYHPLPPTIADSEYGRAVAKLLKPNVKDRFPDAAAAADAFLAVVRGAGHGDPRRLLKQQLAQFAEAQTAGKAKPVKKLEEVDGDSKTYIHKLSTGQQTAVTNVAAPPKEEHTQIGVAGAVDAMNTTQIGIVTEQHTNTAVVTAGVSNTSISTNAMRGTGKATRGLSWVVVAAGVAVVASAVGAYAIMTSTPAKKPPIIAQTPPPLPEPPKPVDVALPQPTDIETPRQLPEAPPEEPAQPPPQPAPQPKHHEKKETVITTKQKGILRVIVVPWGEVFVDGIRMGVTPEVRDLTLTEGQHRVRIVNKDFVAQERTVSVKADDTVKLKVELQ